MTYGYLSIGFGGWTLRSSDDTARLSHYGDTWRAHTHEMAEGIVGLDLTACENPELPGCPSDELVDFSVRGPMVSCTVPEGVASRWGTGTFEPLDWNERYGGAEGFDYVSPRDYARMAATIGARVFDPLAEAAAINGGP